MNEPWESCPAVSSRRARRLELHVRLWVRATLGVFSCALLPGCTDPGSARLAVTAGRIKSSSAGRLASRRRSGRPAVPFALVLAWLLVAVGCGGCRRSSTSVDPESGGDAKSAEQWREELFDNAVNNLHRLEQFSSSDVLAQIYVRFAELSTPPGAVSGAKRDPLMQTCPEPEMLRQIVNRMNQWIQSRPAPDWSPDPLVAGLPGPVRQLPYLADLGKLAFHRYDGFALREAVWLRDVSDWARGEELDGVDRAQRLFDWTVRNVQLEPDTDAGIPLFPWEVLLFGRGSAEERAWVFILLARQQSLEAVLLVPDGADDSRPRPIRPWIAVAVAGELYLFDPVLGLPIPAPDGVKLKPGKPLDIRPATLSEVIADDGLLRRLDVEKDIPYPARSADLKRIEVWVEASPSYLARRMKLVESRLDPRRKMVLATSPTTVANRVVKRLQAAGVQARARLWTLPFETMLRRSQLDPEQVRRRLLAMLPFYAAAVHVRPERASQDEQVDVTDEKLAYKRLGKVYRSRPIAEPLRKGRVLFLKHQFTGPEGAIRCLTAARKPQQELAQDEKDLADLYSKQHLEANRQRPANRRLPEQQVIEMAKQRARFQISFPRRTKQHASYWLGLLKYEQKNYRLAAEYLFQKTLKAFPGGTWEHGVRYNLARTYEASGQHDKAVEYYLSDLTAPGYHGNLLRARWLKAGQPPPTAKEQPPQDQPPPAAQQEPPAKPPEPAAKVPQPNGGP